MICVEFKAMLWRPLLISTIFDKTLLLKDDWVLPWAGVGGTMTLCAGLRRRKTQKKTKKERR